MIKKVTHFFLYRLLMKNFLRIIFGVSYKNTKKFDNIKQFMIVANHNSHLDTMTILSALPTSMLTKVHPVAAGDYFGKNKLSQFCTEFFVNTLLISRNKSSAKANAIDSIDEILKQGHSILIFPEGSRGEAEVIQDFKNGAAILLKKNPTVPFIPIFLKGMGKALPKGDPVLVPMQCELNVGDPVFIDDIAARDVLEITEIIKNNILKLKE